MLSRRSRLDLYQVDDALRGQMERIIPDQHPALSSWLAASCDGRWLKPIDELLTDAIACYTDHFSLILEDLRALPSDRIVLAEGSALLPHLVADLGVQPKHAIWMMPTPAFQRKHYSRRPWVKEMLAGCSNPARAFDNWMQRDILFAEWAADEATRHEFSLIWVDGGQDIGANADLVADHFGLIRQT